MNTMVSQTSGRTISVHNEHEFLLRMEKAGLNAQLAQEVIGSEKNALATKLVRLIENGGYEPSTSPERAREIMRANFFGIEEAIKYFGVNLMAVENAALAEVPFSEERLESCKETHVLVAVFHLSILDIRGQVPQLFFSHEDFLYDEETFAHERGEIGWHLVRKTPVPDSIGKSWNKQQALLGKGEKTPSARVMVYTIIGHYLATGERLFEELPFVRTSTVVMDPDRVYVGYFGRDGIVVYHWWDVSRHNVGISSEHKPV